MKRVVKRVGLEIWSAPAVSWTFRTLTYRVTTMSYYFCRNGHICAKRYSPYNCTSVTPRKNFKIPEDLFVLHHSHESL